VEGRANRTAGFSLVELMVTVMILGILLAVAIPVFRVTLIQAAKRTCLFNQRELEGACGVWLTEDSERVQSDLEGIVDVDHPLLVNGAIHRPPTCPAAQRPADRDHPGLGEGAYVLDEHCYVEPCTFGDPVAHGHY